MFQTLSLCMCWSSHMSLCIMIFASIILGIFRVIVHLFACAQNTQANDSPSLIKCGRLVLADAWLFLLILVSAKMSQTALCLVSLSKNCCRCYSQVLSQFSHVLNMHSSTHVLTDGFICKLCKDKELNPNQWEGWIFLRHQAWSSISKGKSKA